jgi:GNAT superfamily N-acetyltransferase
MEALISEASLADIPLLETILYGMGSSKENLYFEKCFSDKRQIFIIQSQTGHSAGYVQLNWTPSYARFRRFGIPETQDLNILPQFRCQGLGAYLVAHCEALARLKGHQEIGISVGLYGNYGAAQRLYMKRGYIPDGAGIAYDDIPVRAFDLRPVDDLLTLKMIKPLT